MTPSTPGVFTPPICADLKRQAECESAASKMMADAKTARQTDRDDYPEMRDLVGGYAYELPEQTTSWKAADLIAELVEALERATDLIEDAEKDTNWCSGDPYGDSATVSLRALLTKVRSGGEGQSLTSFAREGGRSDARAALNPKDTGNGGAIAKDAVGLQSSEDRAAS